MKIKNKKINLYIGLETNEGNKLKIKNTLKYISKEFIKVGISGFNINEIMGFWENKRESALLISFINTFNLKYEDLKKLIIKFRDDLEQDCILLEVLNIPFEFI